MGVKFSMEESTPVIAGLEDGAKKLKYKQILTKFHDINTSHRHVLCMILTKFSEIVGSFLWGHILKFGEFGQGVPEVCGFEGV